MNDASAPSTAIVPHGPNGVQITSVQVKVDLAAARERARVKLEAIEQRLKGVGDWRGAVRRHPLLTLGGAFVVGYGLAQLFRRR